MTKEECVNLDEIVGDFVKNNFDDKEKRAIGKLMAVLYDVAKNVAADRHHRSPKELNMKNSDIVDEINELNGYLFDSAVREIYYEGIMNKEE